MRTESSIGLILTCVFVCEQNCTGTSSRMTTESDDATPRPVVTQPGHLSMAGHPAVPAVCVASGSDGADARETVGSSTDAAAAGLPSLANTGTDNSAVDKP